MTTSHAQCQELHDALASAKAMLEPPQRDTATAQMQNVISMEEYDNTPNASPDIEAKIHELEQAIREAGCDPDYR